MLSRPVVADNTLLVMQNSLVSRNHHTEFARMEKHVIPFFLPCDDGTRRFILRALLARPGKHDHLYLEIFDRNKSFGRIGGKSLHQLWSASILSMPPPIIIMQFRTKHVLHNRNPARPFHRFDFFSQKLSVFLSFLLAHATSIPMQSGPATPSMQNLSMPNLLLQPQCIASSDWVGNGYVASHCQDTILRLVSAETNVHGPQVFEFLAPDAQPLHAIPVMRTPRRYTVGSPPPLPTYGIPLTHRQKKVAVPSSSQCYPLLFPRRQHSRAFGRKPSPD